MMGTFLVHQGLQTSAVANGQEALDYLHTSLTPHLILLDLMMPVMDGWEFRRRQQADPALSGVPVIVLSSFDHERSGDVGAAAMLTKPLDFDRLLELVRSYCIS
jgi:CheY-like chemotaxis protein